MSQNVQNVAVCPIAINTQSWYDIIKEIYGKNGEKIIVLFLCLILRMCNKMRADLHYKSKCYECKGCYLLQDPNFEGLIQCEQFEQKDTKVWCADEAVADYRRKKRIEQAYQR